MLNDTASKPINFATLAKELMADSGQGVLPKGGEVKAKVASTVERGEKEYKLSLKSLNGLTYVRFYDKESEADAELEVLVNFSDMPEVDAPKNEEIEIEEEPNLDPKAKVLTKPVEGKEIVEKVDAEALEFSAESTINSDSEDFKAGKALGEKSPDLSKEDLEKEVGDNDPGNFKFGYHSVASKAENFSSMKDLSIAIEELSLDEITEKLEADGHEVDENWTESDARSYLILMINQGDFDLKNFTESDSELESDEQYTSTEMDDSAKEMETILNSSSVDTVKKAASVLNTLMKVLGYINADAPLKESMKSMLPKELEMVSKAFKNFSEDSEIVNSCKKGDRYSYKGKDVVLGNVTKDIVTVDGKEIDRKEFEGEAEYVNFSSKFKNTRAMNFSDTKDPAVEIMETVTSSLRQSDADPEKNYVAPETDMSQITNDSIHKNFSSKFKNSRVESERNFSEDYGYPTADVDWDGPSFVKVLPTRGKTLILKRINADGSEIGGDENSLEVTANEFERMKSFSQKKTTLSQIKSGYETAKKLLKFSIENPDSSEDELESKYLEFSEESPTTDE